jgi:hypothetical protein
MSDGSRYFGGGIGGLPKSVSPGRVLAHNHVQHTKFMGHGINGFRCWTWPKEKVPRHFVKCPCGWACLPHVALREHVKASKGKCITYYRFLRNSGMSAKQARAAIKRDDTLRDAA